MFAHDPYAVKALEYLTGVASLLLFIAFWRYVHGEAAPARVRAWSGQLSEWFRMPDWMMFHRGHGWARVDGARVLAVGMNDFAQQLIGPIEGIDLPPAGTELKRGSRGWSIRAGGKSIDMLSPVDGTVIAANPNVRRQADLVNADPYGRGWLLKVKVPRVKEATRDLLSGKAALAWINNVSEELTAAMTPQLGHLAQDGGLPIHGIARGIDEAHWDEIARCFLLTADEGDRS